LIHSIGKISLVSNGHLNRSAFVIGTEDVEADVARRRRRLEEALADIDTADIDSIRDDAVTLFADQAEAEGKYDWSLASPDMPNRKLLIDSAQDKLQGMGMSARVQEAGELSNDPLHVDAASANALPEDEQSSSPAKQEPNQPELSLYTDPPEADVVAEVVPEETKSASSVARKAIEVSEMATDVAGMVADLAASDRIPRWSDIVIPYPFVRDDKDETIRKVKTPAARRMPSREQKLEANAATCEFEINLNVEEEEWTVGEWRTLLSRRIEEAKRLDPASPPIEASAEVGSKRATVGMSTRTKASHDQALVMKMLGTIHSPNCDFTAALNATALRTDWDATKTKTINYSFYMMIVCLTQIMILLRQLLHSQASSAATRVSLLCIGWQTVLDALICVAHIYFSLAMQPLFSAFASVAFFKLLIFCVIEMKYMAIIIQARNSSNGGQSTEVLRRQVAMLHLRFYVALFGSMFLMFYLFGAYRTVFMLALYSFWVPQIVMNVVTEAKAPMHPYYIYGMSLTRLFVPLYVFALQDNFLKEVWPDTKTDFFVCQIVIVWVGIQTAILIAQGKYGARFMIPSRCLPPKFDYSRPLPPSMLPPGALDIQNTESLDESPLNTSSESKALLDEESTSCGRGRHTTAVTTRNRIRGKRANLTNKTESMTSETIDSIKPISPCTHGLDCSICYEGIDVRDRPAYMLAPCDHIFHRDCLVQWMDVKMECPICRTELPAI
jgi:hypothetical protein